MGGGGLAMQNFSGCLLFRLGGAGRFSFHIWLSFVEVTFECCRVIQTPGTCEGILLISSDNDHSTVSMLSHQCQHLLKLNYFNFQDFFLFFCIIFFLFFFS